MNRRNTRNVLAVGNCAGMFESVTKNDVELFKNYGFSWTVYFSVFEQFESVFSYGSQMPAMYVNFATKYSENLWAGTHHVIIYWSVYCVAV